MFVLGIKCFLKWLEFKWERIAFFLLLICLYTDMRYKLSVSEVWTC